MGHTTDSSLNERLIGSAPGNQEASGFTVWDGWKNNMLSGTGGRGSRWTLWDFVGNKYMGGRAEAALEMKPSSEDYWVSFKMVRKQKGMIAKPVYRGYTAE